MEIVYILCNKKVPVQEPFGKISDGAFWHPDSARVAISHENSVLCFRAIPTLAGVKRSAAALRELQPESR